MALVCCLVMLLGGVAMAVWGVFLLAGLGWALIAAAVPCFVVAAVLMRGILSA